MDDDELAGIDAALLANLSTAAMKGLQENDFMSFTDAQLDALLDGTRANALSADQTNWVVSAYIDQDSEA
jgi:hypothetical protein